MHHSSVEASEDVSMALDGARDSQIALHIPGVILVLRYDTCPLSRRTAIQPSIATVSSVIPTTDIRPSMPRLHVVHSGASLRRPRRALPITSIPPSKMTPNLISLLSSVCTPPIIRILKRYRETDDGVAQESDGVLGWIKMCRRTKRRVS
jgi:hypothetical protein